MIYCTIQPKDGYTVTLDGVTVGLWVSYGYDPDLFNLVSRTAVEMFQYESGFECIPHGNRAARLYQDETIIASLDQMVERD